MTAFLSHLPTEFLSRAYGCMVPGNKWCNPTVSTFTGMYRRTIKTPLPQHTAYFSLCCVLYVWSPSKISPLTSLCACLVREQTVTLDVLLTYECLCTRRPGVPNRKTNRQTDITASEGKQLWEESKGTYWMLKHSASGHHPPILRQAAQRRCMVPLKTWGSNGMKFTCSACKCNSVTKRY